MWYAFKLDDTGKEVVSVVYTHIGTTKKGWRGVVCVWKGENYHDDWVFAEDELDAFICLRKWIDLGKPTPDSGTYQPWHIYWTGGKPL